MVGTRCTILAPNFAKWWGSDARSLAQAFRRRGHIILDIDAEDYLPWRWNGLGPKILRRVFGYLWINDYNQAVIKQAENSSFDFILIYKGMYLQTETMKRLRSKRKAIYNFYPDVSFSDHGKHLPSTLSFYNCVFTTKTYHGEREKSDFGIKSFAYVRHGFDPEIHRPIPLTKEMREHYGCDVSFVGCWSPEKEEKILHILRHLPSISMKVYGIGWNYASAELKSRLGANLKPGVFGDELAVVYRASKINLGLLSNGASDSSLKDQTTARTFQIPATNSLMLHEDTPEVRKYFRPDEEIVVFSSQENLIERIKSILPNEQKAKKISEAGYQRCLSEPYDHSETVDRIISYYQQALAEPTARSEYSLSY